MPRKKMKNTSQSKKATAAKRQVKTARSSIEAVEKNFRTLPATIAAQYGKELVALKQQENKLKNQVKKSQAQQKMAKNKCDALIIKMQAKANATLKKQFNTAKKMHEGLTKTVYSINSQIEQVAKQCKMLANNQAKFIMLGKEIAKLEKQWEMNAKKTAKPVKKSPKVAVKKASETSPELTEMFMPKEEMQTTPMNEPAEADA